MVDNLSQSQSVQSSDESEGEGGRSSGSSSSSSHPTTAYTEMIAEVEKISEELLRTQEKLWITEDELEKAKDRNTQLETENKGMNGRSLYEQRKLKDESDRLQSEVERLKSELAERDEYPGRPEAERRLMKAIEFLQKDLDKAREKARKSEAAYGELQRQLESKDIDGLKSKYNASVAESIKARNELDKSAEELAEAREENTKLVEEVAVLRDEIRDSRGFDKRKEDDMRRIITAKIRDELTAKVQEQTENHLIQKLTRQIKSSMKADKDKEINALRNQFKKVFMENAVMSEKLKSLEGVESRNEILEDQVTKLKYEVSSLVETLDKSKVDQEHAVNELESVFRKKLKDFQEQSTKEKWAHGAEIREQLAKERQDETMDYSRRLEALSTETEELLEKAARDKEAYGKELRARILKEKDLEINLIKERMTKIIRESKELLKKSKFDKTSSLETLQRKLESEHIQEISQLSREIETLSTNNERLRSKLISAERKMASMRMTQKSLQAADEEIKELKKHSLYLSNLVEKYKNDADHLLTQRDQLLKNQGSLPPTKEDKYNQKSLMQHDDESSDKQPVVPTDVNSVSPGVSPHVKEYQETLSSKKEEFKCLQDEIKNLCSLLTIDSPENAAAASEISNSEYQTQMGSDLSDKVAKLGTLLLRAEEKHEEVIADLQKFYDENCRLESTLSNVQGEKASMQVLVSKLQETFAEHQQDHQSQMEEFEKSQKENFSMKDNLNELHARYQALSDSSEAERQKISGKIEELEVLSAELASERDRALEEVTSLKQQLLTITADVEASHQASSDELERLTQLLKESSHRSKELEAELASANHALSSIEIKSEERIMALTDKMEILKDSLHESKKQNTQLSNALEHSSLALSKSDDKEVQLATHFQDEIRRLKTMLKKVSEENFSLRDQAQALSWNEGRVLKQEDSLYLNAYPPMADARQFCEEPEWVEQGDQRGPASARQGKKKVRWNIAGHKETDESVPPGKGILKGWKRQVMKASPTNSFHEAKWSNKSGRSASLAHAAATGIDDESLMDETIISSILSTDADGSNNNAHDTIQNHYKDGEPNKNANDIMYGHVDGYISYHPEIAMQTSGDTIDDDFLFSRMRSWEQALDDVASVTHDDIPKPESEDISSMPDECVSRVIDEDDETIISETTEIVRAEMPQKERDSTTEIYTIAEESRDEDNGVKRVEEMSNRRDIEDEITRNRARASSILTNEEGFDSSSDDDDDTSMSETLVDSVPNDGTSATEDISINSVHRLGALPQQDVSFDNTPEVGTPGKRQPKNSAKSVLKTRLGTSGFQSRRQLTVQDMRRLRHRKALKSRDTTGPIKESSKEAEETIKEKELGPSDSSDLENWSLLTSDKSTNTVAGEEEENEGGDDSASVSNEAHMLLLMGSE